MLLIDCYSIELRKRDIGRYLFFGSENLWAKGVCLHCVKDENGKYVKRIYYIDIVYQYCYNDSCKYYENVTIL